MYNDVYRRIIVVVTYSRKLLPMKRAQLVAAALLVATVVGSSFLPPVRVAYAQACVTYYVDAATYLYMSDIGIVSTNNLRFRSITTPSANQLALHHFASTWGGWAFIPQASYLTYTGSNPLRVWNNNPELNALEICAIGAPTSTPSPTPSPTITRTPTPSNTPTPTITLTPTVSNTPTPTTVVVVTITPSPTLTATPIDVALETQRVAAITYNLLLWSIGIGTVIAGVVLLSFIRVRL